MAELLILGQIVLIVLKLMAIITVSWWIVFIPLMILFAVIALTFAFGLTLLTLSSRW